MPSTNIYTLSLHDALPIYNVQSDAHIVRVGLNYKTGWAPLADAQEKGTRSSVCDTYNWAGLYLGVVGGGALQTTVIDDKNCNLSCSSQHLNGSGGTFGGKIGYNYQFGRSGLIGVEADINWADFKAELRDPQWIPNGSLHSTKWNSFSTVRGRAGLTVD